MATNNTPQPLDGDTQFAAGMNSQLDPLSLSSGVYRASMNSVNRGGVVQCRPGYEWKFNMPDGKIQGAYMFSPTNDVEYLVFAIEGSVYASQYPYFDYVQLENIVFRNDVESIYFCQAEKASQVQPDTTVKLITPYKVLMMQDGFSAPGVWDGSTNKHLPDPLDTPMGTAMAWSGNRLWVAREKEIFVSDISDPISFREGTYIANAKSFLLDKTIVALAEITSSSTVALLAFTETSTSAFQSSIRTRSLWETTPNFQQLVFPNIGCVSHRSVVSQYGLLWWYTRFGLTNFNAAQSTYLTSEFRYQDLEMAASKAFVSDNLARVSCAVHENYLLVSVPYADVYNTHTWVRDRTPISSATTGVGLAGASTTDAWNSYWTGTRPAEWIFGPIQGQNRIFQFSIDYDGVNRCWEAFSSERTDNGCAITWTLETRAYTGGNISEKDIRFVQILLAELQGTVDIAAFWAGASKGSFKPCLLKRISADEGVIFPGAIYDSTSQFFSLKKQYRKILSKDIKASPTDSTSCGVESTTAERTDVGFSILVVCSGPGAIRGVRLFMSGETPDLRSGKCEEDEDVTNFVRFDGAGDNDITELYSDPIEYTSSSEQGVSYIDQTFSGEGSAISVISEEDASKISDCQVRNQIDIWQSWVLPKHVGDPSAVGI